MVPDFNPNPSCFYMAKIKGKIQLVKNIWANLNRFFFVHLPKWGNKGKLQSKNNSCSLVKIPNNIKLAIKFTIKTGIASWPHLIQKHQIHKFSAHTETKSHLGWCKEIEHLAEEEQTQGLWTPFYNSYTVAAKPDKLGFSFLMAMMMVSSSLFSY